jgi:hypothetical protein
MRLPWCQTLRYCREFGEGSRAIGACNQAFDASGSRCGDSKSVLEKHRQESNPGSSTSQIESKTRAKRKEYKK